MISLQSVIATAGLLWIGLGLGKQEADRPEFWNVIERAVDKAEARSEFDRVLDHMAGVAQRRKTRGHRLPRVDRGLAEPWIVPELADELRAFLAQPAVARKGKRFQEAVPHIAVWLDLESFEVAGPSAEHDGLRELGQAWQRIEDPQRTGLSLLEAMSSYMELCHSLLDGSLAGLPEEGWKTLFDDLPSFYEAWYRNHFPKAKLSDEAKRSIAAFEKLLAHPGIDRKLVLAVGHALLRWSEPAFLTSLSRRLKSVKEEVDRNRYGADVLAVIGDIPSARVILSGRKGTKHSLPAALRIDLGGDDTYEHAAVVDTPDKLVSVVLDLGGNDTYRADGPGPAFAAGGAALLVDRKGDDRYFSTRLGQAASSLGFAALIDLSGDDEYTAEDYAQGHSTCGVALLYDLEGDDTYTAWAFAQAGGIGYGLCALVDGEGDDRYVADLHWPDVYGNSGPDVYHGASQGYSTGMRSDIPGGVAALLDLGDGSDRYQSGSFSQGGGYYFSFGLMYDDGGDDENFGSRYSQGFGVHQAIGVRWDAAGDDRYKCRSVAHTGMGWDEGVGFLLEDAGDDVYETGDLSCGGAAQTAIAIHLDRGGVDTYRTGRQSQGGSGSSEYHKKPAIGVLIDLGGKKDDYSAEGRSNTTWRATPGVEVFLDAKAKTMGRAVKAVK